MPLDGRVTLIALEGLWVTLKSTAFIVSLLYFGFSLIVVRQIYLMSGTVRTPTAGFLRFLSIIHAGLALGIIILFLGLLI